MGGERQYTGATTVLTGSAVPQSVQPTGHMSARYAASLPLRCNSGILAGLEGFSLGASVLSPLPPTLPIWKDPFVCLSKKLLILDFDTDR